MLMQQIIIPERISEESELQNQIINLDLVMNHLKIMFLLNWVKSARSAEGKYKMENKNIPPCVEISASEVLLEHLRNILSTSGFKK